MRCTQRLYLTGDRKKLVPAGDKHARTLYAVPGDIIPDSAAERFGLVDGHLKGFNPTAGEKEDRGGKDKEQKGGKDKDGQGGGSTTPPATDDLAKLRGVGEKTAKALTAAGYTTFASLAAIDAANPPKVEGLPAVFNWSAVTQAAKEQPAGTGAQA